LNGYNYFNLTGSTSFIC